MIRLGAVCPAAPVMALALALALTIAMALTAAPGTCEARAGSETAGAPLQAVTREGPITATVTLAPAEPRLGDLMTLTLTVAAEPGVGVEMPSFGDALGRFTIVDFAPRAETADDGGARLAQRYTLQATASGRHRVPRLRLEFVDDRPGRGDGEPRELLTDEIGFAVASVLPDGTEASSLRPARDPLPELEGPWIERHWPWLAGGAAGLAVLAAGILAWMRRAAARARLSAFDRAAARLARLRGRGLPASEHVDPWYVELSDIVRRYVEERFALRAPELTTEEFLLEAGRSAELSPAHRDLLSDFLERCDRVKFARYSPGDGESREALDVASRFLDESRAVEGERTGAG